MLNSQYIYQCTDEISTIYADLETEIINDIARRIAKTGKVTATAEWQILKAQEAGALYEEIIKKVAKTLKLSQKETKRLFEEAGLKSTKFDSRIYERAGIEVVPLTQSPAMLQALAAGLAKTNGIIKNLTMTTALTSQQAFIDASDRVYMEITSGAFDYNSAIKRAVKSLAKDGVTMVDYATGRRDHIDVSIRRAVLTGVNQTALKLTESQAKELGAELFETSAHIGARNTGEGPANHQSWQGRRFSVSGESEKYPNFYKATGYGTGEGLGGYNCRHSFHPAFEGTEPSVDPSDYSNKEVTFRGKKMSFYEATQRQREIERNIRRWKREKDALESAGQDSTEERMKIRQWQAEAKAFSEETGVTRRRANEQI